MNLYQGLLFQSGYIADPKLALRLAGSETPSEPAPTSASTRSSASGRFRWLLEELALLGGRPVSRQHLDDVDEPFPPLHPHH